jgi:hypothetical protein
MKVLLFVLYFESCPFNPLLRGAIYCLRAVGLSGREKSFTFYKYLFVYISMHFLPPPSI